MVPANLLNPYKLDPADEYPHAPLPIPNWTEHYYFAAIDPKSQISVFMHVSREPTAPDIWRAVLGITLPGSSSLIGKFCGRDGNEKGPGAGPLLMRCKEPMRRWSVTFDGLMQRTDRTSMTHRPHIDSVVEHVKFDLTFEAAAPIWDLARSNITSGFGLVKDQDEERASHHWDQICKIRGDIMVTGKKVDFDGVGWRDHSHGPRDYGEGALEGSLCISAVFPSGKALLVMSVRAWGHTISGGYLFRNDGSPLEDLVLIDGLAERGNDTPLASIATDPVGDPTARSFDVTFEGKQGRQTIRCELTAVATATTNVSPSHELLGTDFTLAEPGFQFMGCPVRYVLDGEEGFGHFDRTAQIKNLRALSKEA